MPAVTSSFLSQVRQSIAENVFEEPLEIFSTLVVVPALISPVPPLATGLLARFFVLCAIVPNTVAGINVLANGLDWEKGDRIILLDTVVNTGSRSDRDIRLSDRYLHRLKVENR